MKKKWMLPLIVFLGFVGALTVYSFSSSAVSINMLTEGSGGGVKKDKIYCSPKMQSKCDGLSRRCVGDKTGGYCGAIIKTPKSVTTTNTPNQGTCKYQTIVGNETYYIKVGTCQTVFRSDTHVPYRCRHNNGKSEIISYGTARKEDATYGRNFNGRCEAGTSIAYPCCNSDFSITYN